jgi:anti-sigma regulatory factor (Ser/Thr protein kinase)
MTDTCFLPERFDDAQTSSWVHGCATRSGWNAEEADRLAACVSESARAVSERAYAACETGPVFVRLDMADDAATLEMHHEGALGDKPCDCAAARIATERRSSNWTDAQLRTHKLRIARV